MRDRPWATGGARRLFAARLTASLMPLNSTMVAVAVPDVAAELGHPQTTVTQALVATYLVAAIALQSPGGTLGDRLGAWRVVVLGQAVLGAGALLGMVAQDLVVLTVARVLMAAGGALVVPATVALMRLELPPERRGRAFGTFSAVMGLAAAVGPVVGGVLVEALGWEAVFLANLPVLVVAALVPAGVPATPAPGSDGRVDGTGSALLTAGLVLVVLGAQGDRGAALALLAAGGAVLALFVAWERRTSHPVVDLGLFRSLPFAAGSSLIALQNLVLYALLFELPLVLGELFALGARGTGQLLAFLTVAMVGASLLSGRLTDGLGPRPTAVCGALLCLLGVGLLHVSGLSAVGDVRLPLCLLGAGVGLSSPAAQTASLSAVDPARSGMAAGVGSTMRYLGAVAGIALLGRSLDLEGTRAQVLAEHSALLVAFAVVLLGSLVCAVVLPGRAEPVDGRPPALRGRAAAPAAEPPASPRAGTTITRSAPSDHDRRG